MRDNVEISVLSKSRDFTALSINIKKKKNDDLKSHNLRDGNIEQDWRITSFTSIEQAHRQTK